jgi:hypothetical protein
MAFNALGGQGKWVSCKHLYYVLQHVMYCQEVEDFSTWSWDEVQHLLSYAIASK